MQNDWQNISDDEFDGLFRESAERKDVGFDADSWQKMSQKLDSLPKTEKDSAWKRLIPLILLLLIGSVIGGYFWLSDSDKNDTATTEILGSNEKEISENLTKDKTEKNTTLKEEVNSIKEENSIVESKEKSRENLTKSGEKANDFARNAASKEENNLKSEAKVFDKNFEKNKILKEKSNNSNQVSRKRILVFENKKTIFSTQKTNFSDSKSQERIFNNSEKNTSQTSESISRNNQISTNTNQPITSIGNTNSESKNTEVIHNSTELSTIQNQEETLKKWELWGVNENLKGKNLTFKSDWKLPTIGYTPNLPTKIQTNEQGIPFKRGFNLRLNFSPDLSTIGTNAIEKIGINYGALIEYRFNRRWSVQTGLLRSTKIYDAYPEQYTWPWRKPYTPLVEINATCKMVDMPINIRFDITNKPKSRWFVSAGATTYKMLNELYLYQYENNNDPSIRIRQWAGSTGTYGLKVVNFSTGYEWQIQRKMSLQVEPFAKIPTKKIGFGEVKLMTFGVFFSGKYHFGK